MAKKKEIDTVKLSAFPEEVDEASGVKVYGKMSYETQMAVLSQYLHSPELHGEEDEVRKKREEIIFCIREYLEHKTRDDVEDYDDEQIWRVAEDPLQYNLFNDFFKDYV